MNLFVIGRQAGTVTGRKIRLPSDTVLSVVQCQLTKYSLKSVYRYATSLENGGSPSDLPYFGLKINHTSNVQACLLVPP